MQLITHFHNPAGYQLITLLCHVTLLNNFIATHGNAAFCAYFWLPKLFKISYDGKFSQFSCWAWCHGVWSPASATCSACECSWQSYVMLLPVDADYRQPEECIGSAFQCLHSARSWSRYRDRRPAVGGRVWQGLHFGIEEVPVSRFTLIN